MKVVLGNDHAAVDMKFKIKEFIESMGHEVINVGIDEVERCDYPDYAYAACEKIVKVKGIRACACSESYSARLSREHNNANVVCFGERVIGIETAKEIVKSFLNAEYQGAHHVNRVQKIMDIEKGTYKI